MVGDGSNDYILDWKTSDDITFSIVHFGKLNEMHLQLPGHYSGTVLEANNQSVHCWWARLRHLEIGQTYAYMLDTDVDEKMFQFTVPDPNQMTWAIFADLGAENQGGASGASLPALRTHATEGTFDGIFHLGDLGYELTGQNGQNFMNQMEPMVSEMPFHTTVGNHEYRNAPEELGSTMHNYKTRFHGLMQGAGASSKSDSNRYYSLNSGSVHFIIIDTEFYSSENYYVEQSTGTWDRNEDARFAEAEIQVRWLRQDLAYVNRTLTPFIVVCGHRPPFKTPHLLTDIDNRFFKEIVPLLSDYRVDLFICGHVHAYVSIGETWLNGYRIPPIIVSGAAGSSELVYSREDTNLGNFVARKYVAEYGYGYLTATCDALHWKWGRTASRASDPHVVPSNWTLHDKLEFKAQTHSPVVSRVRGSSGETLEKEVDSSMFVLIVVVIGGIFIAMNKSLLRVRRTRRGYHSVE